MSCVWGVSDKEGREGRGYLQVVHVGLMRWRGKGWGELTGFASYRSRKDDRRGMGRVNTPIHQECAALM